MQRKKEIIPIEQLFIPESDANYRITNREHKEKLVFYKF